MNFSVNGLKFIGEAEGSSSTVYPDSGGAPTIGIGHLLTKGEKASGKIVIKSLNGMSPEVVKYSSGLTNDQISRLLLSDLVVVEEKMKLVRVPLTQYQYDTLVSFTFNVGNDAFENSTLLKRLNLKEYKAIPEQLMRWVHDNGKEVSGLINRRKLEVSLWNNSWRIKYNA